MLEKDKLLHDAPVIEDGTVDYAQANENNVIPVATFNHGKVNQTSIADLELSVPQEFKSYDIVPGDKFLLDQRYQLTSAQAELNEKLAITVQEEAVAEMILNYEDDGLGSYKRYSEYEIVAKPHAQLTLFLVQRLSEKSESQCKVRVKCEPNSEVRIIIADSGAKAHRLDLRTDMEERSLFDCQGIYFGRGQERYDYNYNLVHHGILCQSNLLVNGALKDEAKKVFRGTIDFRKGSSGSVGAESEYVTLLDDTVHSIAIPLLLCTEDNVEGNHAASAGRLDKDMVFYVMSRGFSKKEADKLIVASRFSHVLDLLPNSELKDAVLGDILAKMEEA